MKTVKKIALSGMLSALIVVILSIGSLFESLDMCVAAIAAFAIMLAKTELGSKYSIMIYIVCSVLAVLLLPNKYGALIFAMFYGYYPIVKKAFESKIKQKVLVLILKLAVFCVSTLLTELIWIYLFGIKEALSKPLIICLAVLSVITFLLFDTVLDRLVLIYEKVWRKHLQKFL